MMPFDVFLFNRLTKTKQFLFSSLLLIMVSALCFVFSPFIRSEIVAFILLLALSVIAMFFDILPVLCSAALSALILTFFFLHPRFGFRISSSEDRIMLSMFFIIALVNAVLTFKIRQIEKTSRSREEKTKLFRLYNTLLNSLSHELRTPIATIMGASDNLLSTEGNLTGADRHQLLSAISLSSLRLNRQVENLLNMSRLESGVIRPKKDWCNIQELVADVLGSLGEEAREYNLVIDIPENMPLIRLDYGLMEQVIYNLLHNAIQYTPEYSEIRLEASYRDKRFLLQVKDSGPGFPESEMAKVFEKFYRLPNSRAGGSGLGLSIAKGFIEAHDGEIFLSNNPADGAVFRISMPAEKLTLKQPIT